VGSKESLAVGYRASDIELEGGCNYAVLKTLISLNSSYYGNDPTDPDTVFVFPGLYDPAAGETFPVMVRSYTALIGVDTSVVLEANSDTLPVVEVLDEVAFWLQNLEIREGWVGILASDCLYFCIYKNNVHHNRDRGVRILNSERFKIVESSIASNTGGGLEINRGVRAAITGNTLMLNSIRRSGTIDEIVGGGISILSSRRIRVKGNVVSQNELTYHGDWEVRGRGGGIQLRASSDITLLGNSITGNAVELYGFWGGGITFSYGGGVYVAGGQRIKLRNNLICDNRLYADSDELALSQGGGIYVGAGSVIIRRNRIQGNEVSSDTWDTGGGGIFIAPGTEAIVQNNIITSNLVGIVGNGGGILLCGQYYEGVVIGGEPGGGNDIYWNDAIYEGDDLACLECPDTVTATFNYFEDPPDPTSIYPLGNWDTRFWRDNSILENEPPHILDYFPTCAETTLYVGDSLLFWIESLDYDGDSTFTWWLLNGQQVAEGDSFLFVAEPQHVGYDTVQVNVTDGRAVTSHEWYVQVVGDRLAPIAKPASLPETFALEGNYPNPFNLSTMIKYQLPVDCYVRLEVYDLLGRKIAILVEGEQEAGYRSVIWGASELSSGIYLYKLTAGEYTKVKKMMLVK